jgi:FAD dependent oxidoreductase
VKEFQIAVVGGGITGLGIAHYLQSLNYQVALFEKNNLALATSANSHRIIHGGFRYIPQFNFNAASKSLRSLSYLRATFPDEVKPLKSYIELNRFGLRSPLSVAVGINIYKQVVKKNKVLNLTSPKIVSLSESDILPSSDNSTIKKYLIWEDGFLLNNHSLVAKLKSGLISQGGEVFENSEVTQMSNVSEDYLLKVNSTDTFLARFLVTALNSENSFNSSTIYCQAINLVFKGEKCINFGFAAKSQEGRLLFLAPRNEGDKSFAIGTHYFEAIKSNTEAEILVFLKDCQTAFPSLKLDYNKIIMVESGAIPIAGWRKNGSPLFIGDTRIERVGKRHLNLVATKYTTFPETAKEVACLLNREF